MNARTISLMAFALVALAAAQAPNGTPEEPADLSKVVISLERTSCYGTCPVYKLEISGDGSVQYEGRQFVRQKGMRTGRIPEAKVKTLVSSFWKMGFFSLQDAYITRELELTDPKTGKKHVELQSVTDLPTQYVSISFPGYSKRVKDYAFSPPALQELEKLIDDTAGVQKWVFYSAPDLEAAITSGAVEIAKQGPSLLTEAIRWNDPELIRLLIRSGVDVNRRDGYYSPLSYAAAVGKMEALKVIVDSGASIDFGSQDGASPLLESARAGSLEAARYLLEHGANVNAVDRLGRTPLIVAADEGNPELIDLLLHYRADRNFRDQEGRRALEAAKAQYKVRMESPEVSYAGEPNKALSDYLRCIQLLSQ